MKPNLKFKVADASRRCKSQGQVVGASLRRQIRRTQDKLAGQIRIDIFAGVETKFRFGKIRSPGTNLVGRDTVAGIKVVENKSGDWIH